MKIVFAGGGTGGHFYPIIAIGERINRIVEEQKIVECSMYYFSTTPFDKQALYDTGIKFERISAGKWRRYFSIENFFDLFKTFVGIGIALSKLFVIYPDVVVSKGGYASFPTVVAARILGIPIFIHESDTHPGRVNVWSKRFAKRIAVSYESASQYFPKNKTVWTGHPVREELMQPAKDGAYEYFNLNKNFKTIFIIGGSLGAQKINDAVLDALPKLVSKYQVIHMTGIKNKQYVEETAKVVLSTPEQRERYKIVPYLNVLGMRMASGMSQLVVSRAGSTIFEIAYWGLPSIIIPIPESVSHDQKTNAYNFARTGACEVIEENNLSGTILFSEIDRLLTHDDVYQKMAVNTKKFGGRDGARVIADEVVAIALTHEK